MCLVESRCVEVPGDSTSLKPAGVQTAVQNQRGAGQNPFGSLCFVQKNVALCWHRHGRSCHWRHSRKTSVNLTNASRATKTQTSVFDRLKLNSHFCFGLLDIKSYLWETPTSQLFATFPSFHAKDGPSLILPRLHIQNWWDLRGGKRGGCSRGVAFCFAVLSQWK